MNGADESSVASRDPYGPRGCLTLLGAWFVRLGLWLVTRLFYRVRITGLENIPRQGGALIVANHVTWVDGFLMLTSASRPVRFMVYANYSEIRWLRWLSRLMGVIPVNGRGGARSIVESLNAAKEAIRRGEIVCIFPEGSLTRTGQLQTFNRGILKVIDGTEAPVIPAYLHGLWGSIFSYAGGRFFWKRPRKIPYPVRIIFGKPLHNPQSVHEVRQQVEWLGTEAEEMEKSRRMIPARQFIRQCKRRRSLDKIADSSGKTLTGGRTLAGSLALLRVLERDHLKPDEKAVGLLLPPSVGGALANLAVSLSGRTTVNLNYTLPDNVLNYCVKAAGVKHVLTSRAFLEKKPTQLEGAEFVFLEDVAPKVSKWDTVMAALGAFVLPASLLERRLGLHRISPDETLTIIFTSGSTGEPKGVVLSHENIAANIASVDQILDLTTDDCLMGVLPFFHSFGFTVCLWLVMCFDAKAVYHFNPLDAKMIGSLAEKHGMTILLATPTFLKMYLKRCTKEQFHKLDLVVVGAEKLPPELAEQFEKKFGIYPTEGYGTTELSPVASCNVPDHRGRFEHQIGTKPGTVGRPIPNVAAKVVDPDTFEDRGLNTEGLLLIKGANVMQGYLNQPEKTAEVIRDGWYVTGDIARIDQDGFIEITGRMSRFSKIGGEMVPHIRIEQILAGLVERPESEDDTAIPVAVTAVPDSDRGERLVVLHRPLPMPVDQLIVELKNAGLPNLWLPSRDSFFEVEQIPVLGSGKLDLRGIKQTALEKTHTKVI